MNKQGMMIETNFFWVLQCTLLAAGHDDCVFGSIFIQEKEKENKKSDKQKIGQQKKVL